MSMNIQQENPHKSSTRDFFSRATKWLDYKDKAKWIKDMKNSIGITVSIIITMTFSLATNPPGGVVQFGLENKSRCSNMSGYYICGGEAILASFKHEEYHSFLVCDIICFIASVCVLLLLVSGAPIDKPFTVWFLSIGMIATLISLALTFLYAANMVTPDNIWNSVSSTGFGVALIVLICVVGAVALFFLLSLIGIVHKCRNDDK